MSPVRLLMGLLLVINNKQSFVAMRVVGGARFAIALDISYAIADFDRLTRACICEALAFFYG